MRKAYRIRNPFRRLGGAHRACACVVLWTDSQRVTLRRCHCRLGY